MYKKILLAYDGSKGGGRALEAALKLAKLHGAELWALSVEETLPRFAATMDEVQEEKEFANRYYGQLLEEAGKIAREAGVELHPLLRAGHRSARCSGGRTRVATAASCSTSTPRPGAASCVTLCAAGTS